MLSFACYFPFDNPRFFLVDVKDNGWVEDLCLGVCARLKVLGREISDTNLRLFKTDLRLEPHEDLQTRALEWLHQQPEESHLNIMKRLTSIFPDGPNESERLDILVTDVEAEGLGDTVNLFKRKLKRALDERLARVAPKSSPSDIVSSHKNVAQLLGGPEPNIYLGRPGGPPVAMFSPPLAALQQDLAHLDEVHVTPVDINRAAAYLCRSAEFYDNEATHQDAIRNLINDLMENKGEWEFSLPWASNIKPDASWWYNIFLIMVLELKNTLGIYGDALLQATVDYSKAVPQRRYGHLRDRCNFPIILIGITANRLEISAAVCPGPIYVSKLLSLDLSLGFHASRNILHVARVFKALSASLRNLREYYDQIGNSSSPAFSCLFPSPTILDPSKKLPQLVYQQSLSRTGQPMSALLDLGATATAMYIATLSDTNKRVIVKFTAQYNEVAHCLLADAQLAPRLHFCGQVIGDLYMVVMDYIDGSSVWQLRQDGKPVPVTVSETARKAVNLLHDNDIVFADLRDPNILVTTEGHVLLIDFDWPGRDGESRYPTSLNPSNDWAEGVQPYGIMQKAHDEWQLKRLHDLCHT